MTVVSAASAFHLHMGLLNQNQAWDTGYKKDRNRDESSTVRCTYLLEAELGKLTDQWTTRSVKFGDAIS